MTTPQLRCLGYLRVSTERQAGEQYTSLADQERAIAELAIRLERPVERWFRDAGASGAAVATRVQFQAMLDYCAAHPCPLGTPGLVLCLNDSRFGRFDDPDQAAALRFQLKQSGWHVRFVESDEIQDVTMRTVVRAIGSAQASEYRANLSRNSRRGMRGAAELGYWRTRAPFGYRRQVVFPAERTRVLDHHERKADGEKVALTPGPDDEVAFVRWCFEEYAAGHHTLGSLARAAHARYPHWRVPLQSVRALLTNPAYVGDVIGGRRTYDVQQRRHVRPAAALWYGKRDAHPALVTRELFAAVQARMAEHALQGRAAVSPYALTRLVTCAVCGGHYAGGGRWGRRPHETFYKCVRSVAIPKGCPGPIGVLKRDVLEQAVIDLVAAEVRQPAVRRAIGAAIDRALAKRREAVPDAERRAQLHASLVAKRDRLVRAIGANILEASEAAGELATIRAAIAAHAPLPANQAEAVRAAHELESLRGRLVAMAADFPRMARAVTGVALRELVAPWLERATYDKRTRELVVRIRRLPAVRSLHSESSPGRGASIEGSAAIERRVQIPRVKALGVVARETDDGPGRRA